MLISIGRRPGGGDLVDLLLECHERIRSFVRLAKTIGENKGIQTSDIVEASLRCERYFTEALPLHVNDEEMSILPRLKGHTREIDSALDAMRKQHTDHGPHLDQLLGALRTLQSEPGNHLVRGRLEVVATQLTSDFDDHLSLEENTIFPAIRVTLPSDEQLAVIGELRARRQ